MSDETQNQAIIQAAKDHKYEVRGIRTFQGREGCGGFNATLYREGKKVAFIINEDDGGMFDWDWGGYKSEADRKAARAEEEKLMALCKTIPDAPSMIEGADFTISCDLDIFISVLVGQVEEERWWKRKCKTKTCVILKSHQDGQFIQYSVPYDERIKKHVQEKYGDDLKEIVNERFLQGVTA